MKPLLCFLISFQLMAQDEAPGTLYYRWVTKSDKEGGLGLSPKEAVDWIYRLPKKVVFNYKTFEKNYQKFLAELGTEKVKEATQKAIEQTEKESVNSETRPRTLEEAKLRSGDLDLLRSTKRVEKALELKDPYEMKEYRGFGYPTYLGAPFFPYYYRGLEEYYYFEERLTPRKPGEAEGKGTRIGVGVSFDRFRLVDPNWGRYPDRWRRHR